MSKNDNASADGLAQSLPGAGVLGAPVAKMSALLAKRHRGWELGLPSYVETRGRTSAMMRATSRAKMPSGAASSPASGIA